MSVDKTTEGQPGHDPQEYRRMTGPEKQAYYDSLTEEDKDKAFGSDAYHAEKEVFQETEQKIGALREKAREALRAIGEEYEAAIADYERKAQNKKGPFNPRSRWRFDSEKINDAVDDVISIHAR